MTPIAALINRRLALVCLVWALLVWASHARASADATWQPIKVPSVAGVTEVATSTATPGIAWTTGTGRPTSASGVTADGGRTWTPIPDVSAQNFAVGADPSLWWRLSPTNASLSSSTDGGATWNDLPGFRAELTTVVATAPPSFPTLTAAGAVLLADPDRAGVVFVVVSLGGEYGATQSVIESTDGGVTWSAWQPAFVTDEKEESGFAMTWRVLPGRDALLLARVGSIGGSRYETLEVVSSAGVRVLHHQNGRLDSKGKMIDLDYTSRIDVDPSGSRVLLESRTRGWLLSTDGGVHLRRLGIAVKPRGIAPAFDPSKAGRIYGVVQGVLWRSDDDGQHWHALSHDIPGASGLSVDAGGVIYAYGRPGLAISRDEGRTFRRTNVFAEPVEVNAIRPRGQGQMLAATDAGVFVVGAGGAWTSFDRTVIPLPAIDVAPLGHTRGVIAFRSDLAPPVSGCCDGGRHLEWSEDGRSWTGVRGTPAIAGLPSTADMPAVLASDDDARRVILGRSWTRDGGQHWHTPPRGVAASVPPLLPQTRYVTRDADGGAATRVLRSRVLGQASPIGLLPDRDCTAVAASPSTVYVGCENSIWRSINGRAFAEVTTPPGRLLYAPQAIDSESSARIALETADYSACADTETGATLISRNGGTTWEQVDDACGIAIRSPGVLAFAPGNRLLRFGGDIPGVDVLDLSAVGLG